MAAKNAPLNLEVLLEEQEVVTQANSVTDDCCSGSYSFLTLGVTDALCYFLMNPDANPETVYQKAMKEFKRLSEAKQTRENAEAYFYTFGFCYSIAKARGQNMRFRRLQYKWADAPYFSQGLAYPHFGKDA